MTNKYLNRFLQKSESDLLIISMRVNGHQSLFDERDLTVITSLIEEYQKTEKLKNKLTILLHSQGGDLVLTIKLATILQAKYSQICTVVYNVSKSSMSLMALSGTTIYLHEKAMISDFSINENESLSQKDLRNINIEIIKVLEKGVLKTEPKNEATTNALKAKMMLPTNPHGTDISYDEIKQILDCSVKPPSEIGVYNFHLANIHAFLLNEFEEKTGVVKILGFNSELVSD